jgi:polysaccharide biosynthesis/export protein
MSTLRLYNLRRETMLVLATAGILLFGGSATKSEAQTVDPDILEQLQRQQGIDPTRQVTPAPVDVAREDELEHRDQARAAAQIAAATISRLEEDYRERTGNEDLLQYGYDMFAFVSMDTGANIGSIPSNYVLGVGDELVVFFVGSTERSVTTSVDREGRAILPDLPPIAAAGRNFGDFVADVQARVSEALLGTEVYISLGSVRQLGIYVLGEVSIPGLHNLNSMSSVFQALASAGGVKKTGSLRNVQIITDAGASVVDLYALINGGAAGRLSLSDGARVIVPAIGDTVAVIGSVGRPAIYELPANASATLAGVLNRAGGTLRPRGNDVTLTRINDAGQRTVSAVENGGAIIGGDVVDVRFKSDLLVGEVRLEGHVNVEGPRALSAAPTVSALIGGRDGLGETPYLLFAVLETTDPSTQARLLKHVNLERILADIEDVTLRDRDRLVVFSAEDVSFLSSALLREVVLSGEYGDEYEEEDQCQSMVGLADAIQVASGGRFEIVSRSVFFRPERQEDPLESGSSDASDRDAGDLDAGDPNAIGGGDGAGNVNIIARPDQVETSRQADRQRSQDEGQRRDQEERLEQERIVRCGGVFEENTDFLPLALDNAVSQLGAVQRPGIFPVSRQTTLASLVAVAGGFTLQADVSNVELLTQAQGVVSSRFVGERSNYDLSDIEIATINVFPGSSVRVSQRRSDQEAGTVLLTGEVMHPGIYTILRGETLSQVLERAGGITDFAYPYGAVFTRLRVKEIQEEAFRRAAREINDGITIAAVRADVAADALDVAKGLADELGSIEALGRVVVEVDPAILRVRPELDTILEPGDQLIIPKRPNFILVSGDVLNPGAVQFVTGKGVNEYLTETGGFSRGADDDRVYVVYPNGVAEPVESSRWSSSSIVLPPGTAIFVPKNLDPFTTLEFVQAISSVISQLALSAASIAVISR